MPTPPLVLIVDDEQVNLELSSTILCDEGYRTLTASTVDDALQLLQSDKPDIIISAIAMPGMGGPQLYEGVRKMQGLGSVPFIFLCPLSDWKHVREGRKLGAGDYLTKPLDIDELLTTVKENLRHAASLRNSMQSELRR
jgi:DNA-binding response OmpR family regulator